MKLQTDRGFIYFIFINDIEVRSKLDEKFDLSLIRIS